MKRPGFAVAFVLGCALLTSPATADEAFENRLAGGYVSVRADEVKGSDAPKITVRAVIDSPIENVWEVVNDCAKLKDRMPSMLESRVVKRTADAEDCYEIIDLPWPIANLELTVRARKTKGANAWVRRWQLVSGDFLKNTGSWTLKRFRGSKTRTRIQYQVHAEPDMAVPDWLRESAQKSSMYELIERLREESKKVAP